MTPNFYVQILLNSLPEFQVPKRHSHLNAHWDHALRDGTYYNRVAYRKFQWFNEKVLFLLR